MLSVILCLGGDGAGRGLTPKLLDKIATCVVVITVGGGDAGNGRLGNSGPLGPKKMPPSACESGQSLRELIDSRCLNLKC